MTYPAHQSEHASRRPFGPRAARRPAFSLVFCAAVIAIAGACPARKDSLQPREAVVEGYRPTSSRSCRSGRRCRISPCRASTARRTRAPSTRARSSWRLLFESNHCPVSQLYESRTERLYEDYAQGRHVCRDQSEQRQGGSTERARVYGRDRLAAGNEDSRGVPRHRVAVPLRRRDTGALEEFRRRRHAAHLLLRPGSQAAISGPDRRQPARGAGQNA